MKHSNWLFVRSILITLAVVLAFAGCATKGHTPKDAPSEFLCAINNNVLMDVADVAQVRDFACSFKKWEGAETLHFKVVVKNLAAEPKRFKVNIFLDNGKAVGGLIPRKTNKGLIAPGAEAAFTYPVKGVTKQPKEVLLKIRTVE